MLAKNPVSLVGRVAEGEKMFLEKGCCQQLAEESRFKAKMGSSKTAVRRLGEGTSICAGACDGIRRVGGKRAATHN